MTGALVLLALLGAAPAAPASDVDALVGYVIASQRRAERSLPPHTYDQHTEEIAYGRDGRPKSLVRKLYAVTSPGGGGESSRELLEVDGRPATAEEIREVALEDDRDRRRRIDRRAAGAAGAAASSPGVRGEEDDPVVGPRRLSHLLSLYDYNRESDEVHDGRPCHVLSFRPRRGAVTHSLGDRVLAALAGRVVVDAEDLQVRSATARIVTPIKVAGGIAAHVKEGSIDFEAQRVAGGYWLPCRIDLRFKGTTALFFRLDREYDFRMENFRRFAVSTEASVTR
jgi:hypothetical protein